MNAGAMAALTLFSLRRRLSGWRGLAGLATALFPSLLAVVFRSFAPLEDPAVPRPWEFYGEFLAPISLYFVLPFVSMIVMLPALGELYEKGAIGYLLTRPVSRTLPVLALSAGGFLATIPFLVVAAWLPGLFLQSLGGISFSFWLERMVWLSLILALGAATYGSLCVFLGVWSRRPFLWALALLFGLGSIAGSITGPLRDLSPHRYLFALLRDRLDLPNVWSEIMVPGPDPPGSLEALGMLLLGAVLFQFLAARAIRRRDVL